MQRLLEFIGHHPYLVAAAVLAAIVVVVYELRARVQAFCGIERQPGCQAHESGALVIDLRSKDLFDAGTSSMRATCRQLNSHRKPTR